MGCTPAHLYRRKYDIRCELSQGTLSLGRHDENRMRGIRCSGSTGHDLHGTIRQFSRSYPTAPRICPLARTGVDSAVGSITRPGGLIIEYDIGPLAGVYTDCKTCGWT